MSKYDTPVEYAEDNHPRLHIILRNYDYIIAGAIGHSLALVMLTTFVLVDGIQNGFPVSQSETYSLYSLLQIYGMAIVAPLLIGGGFYILKIGETDIDA